MHFFLIQSKIVKVFNEGAMKLSEQKRIHILDAAEQLFFVKGVVNSSMDEVAKTAGVSKRTVYNHFETKDVLFYAIIERMMGLLKSTSIIVFDHDETLKDQLIKIAQQECSLFKSDNFLRVAKIAFMQMMQKPEFAKQLSNNKIGCMAYLEQFFDDAEKAKKVTIDDKTLAAMQFVYLLKSHIFYPRLYGFDVPNDHQEHYLIEQTVELFLARYQSKS